jgi:hypothetical protein
MNRSLNQYTIALAAGMGAAIALAPVVPAQAAWEPTRPVEFIIPAGTGGGADIMARTIQGIVQFVLAWMWRWINVDMLKSLLIQKEGFTTETPSTRRKMKSEKEVYY